MLAVFSVESTLDTQDANPGDGQAQDAAGRTTLRAAIMEANAWDDGGADTINLPAGTYSLQVSGTGEDAAVTGDLDVRDDLTIIGAGAEETIIDASGLSSRDRVFHVHRGTSDDRVALEIQGITITGGLASGTDPFADRAGGLFVDFFTDVTILESVFRDNSAPRTRSTSVYGLGGAITNSGNLEIVASRFENNLASNAGGAIYVGGSNANTIIRDSTFSGNSSRDGGAIEARETVDIRNSTFLGNRAINSRGTGGSGGVIKQVGGVVTAINSTFSNNESIHGGGFSVSGTLQLINSTVTNNSASYGGGILVSVLDTVVMENSILGDNIASVQGPDVRGGVTSQGHNLISNSSDSSGWLANDLLDVDPRLAPLADNGGPTQTHAIELGSPAIDAADSAAAPSTDQRGVVRPQGQAADIGAFELSSSTNSPPLARADAYVVNEDGTLVVGGPADAILHYDFDESDQGTDPVLDRGSDPAADGLFVGEATRTSSTPAAHSTGALDLTPGADSINYVTESDAEKIDALTEMTATLWLNLRGDPQAGDVLLSDLTEYPPFPNAGTSGWELRIAGPSPGVEPTADNFSLQFETAQIGTNLANSQFAHKGAINAEEQWVFLAATLTTRGQFTWYHGDENAQVTDLGHTNFAPQYLPLDIDNPSDLRIGASAHEPLTDRTPPAWIDDVRIYDRVLDSEELDRIRLANISAAVGVLVNDSDPDDDPLTVGFATQPTNGTFDMNADGSFQYTPDPDFNGTDRFTYQAGDNTVLSNSVVVTITVAPQPDLPVAENDTVITDENVEVSISVLSNDSDVDGDALTIADVGDPARGTASANADGTVTYTPASDFDGIDTFSYTVSDGNGGTDTATVTVTVTPGYEPPVAVDDVYTAAQDTPLEIVSSLGISQWDQESLKHDHVISTSSYDLQQLVRAGMTGRLDSVDIYIGFDAHVGSVLTVEFHRGEPWQSDAAEYSSQTTIASNMTGGWVTVDMSSAAIDLFAGEVFTIATNGSGTGPGEHLYVGMSREQNVGDAYPDGQLWSDGNPRVSPGSGFDLTFRTRMRPVTHDLGVLRNDSQFGGGPLTAILVSSTSHGDLALEPSGDFTYTPDTGFIGTDTFTYRANDGIALSNEATVSITVQQINRPPKASDDTVTTNVDTPVSLDPLGNDTDPDGDSLTVLRVTQPRNGQAIIENDQTVRFIPDPGFSRTDQFVYTISDGNGGVDSATVSIVVRASVEPPKVVQLMVNGDQIDPLDIPGRGGQPTTWSDQRSDIRSIVIQFSEEVLIDATDIRLTNLGRDAVNDPDVEVPISQAQIQRDGNRVVIEFPPTTDFDLTDGVYKIELMDSVSSLLGVALDGNGDGFAGGIYSLAGGASNGLYELKSDWNADGGVSIFDFPTFTYWFGSRRPLAPEYVDLNFDGGVSIFDFPMFALSFAGSVQFPVAFQGFDSERPQDRETFNAEDLQSLDSVRWDRPEHRIENEFRPQVRSRTTLHEVALMEVLDEGLGGIESALGDFLHAKIAKFG